MNVLLAVDSSHSHVVEAAASRPWPSGTKFFLVSVVDMRHWEGLPALIEDARHEAQSTIKKATERLKQAGCSVTSEIPEGNPKELILAHAQKSNADLILIGSHGHNAAIRFLLGSTAQSVLRNAVCSVEIVRGASEPADRGMRILLATDGSPCSLKAVDEVAMRPWPNNTAVEICSAVQLLTADVPSLASEFRSPTPELVDELTKISRDRAEEGITSALKKLKGKSVEVLQKTPLGEPRAAILDEAKEWDADLIVLGSHGRHSFGSLILGSVADFVAEYAKCSVEVVR
jgi:nucleotide-binding universal stress UspA family protein